MPVLLIIPPPFVPMRIEQERIVWGALHPAIAARLEFALQAESVLVID